MTLFLLKIKANYVDFCGILNLHCDCDRAVTVACHVISVSGRLVDVNVLELSESPCSGVNIFCPSRW